MWLKETREKLANEQQSTVENDIGQENENLFIAVGDVSDLIPGKRDFGCQFILRFINVETQSINT